MLVWQVEVLLGVMIQRIRIHVVTPSTYMPVQIVGGVILPPPYMILSRGFTTSRKGKCLCARDTDHTALEPLHLDRIGSFKLAALPGGRAGDPTKSRKIYIPDGCPDLQAPDMQYACWSRH